MKGDVILNNVSLRFADKAAKASGATGVAAIAALNMQFAQGSFTALVGPSGCGKTTLLRLIAGLLTPTSGTLTKPNGRVGFVFQTPVLLAWRNVRDNVALPLKMQNIAPHEIATRTQAALQLVGLESRDTALPRELSGGMKMRVSLARALVQQPDILLMDEPFGALDELTRHKLDDELLAIWRARRCTIIFVTHSMSEAAYLAEQVMVLTKRGQLASQIAIDHPHNGEDFRDFRASPAYHAAYQAIANALGHNALEHNPLEHRPLEHRPQETS